MRALILSFFVLLSAPAFAADWSHYDNGRFGYGIDIPPGFSGLGEAGNGDGQVFRSASGRETLAVWAGNILDNDFSGEVNQRIASAQDEGWNITYQATTPRWASYSGAQNGSVLYARAISLCDGAQAAYFTLEYSKLDVVKLDPVVNRLVQSLSGSGNC
jgi:hypothetical protein